MRVLNTTDHLTLAHTNRQRALLVESKRQRWELFEFSVICAALWLIAFAIGPCNLVPLAMCSSEPDMSMGRFMGQAAWEVYDYYYRGFAWLFEPLTSWLF